MRRFYRIDKPDEIVLADTVAAIHGAGHSYPRPQLTAWVARAMANGKLAQPCSCCTEPTDMITEIQPGKIVPESEFYRIYREMSGTIN